MQQAHLCIMARYVPQFRVVYASSALTQKNIENVLNLWGANLLSFLMANPEAHQTYVVRLLVASCCNRSLQMCSTVTVIMLKR